MNRSGRSTDLRNRSRLARASAVVLRDRRWSSSAIALTVIVVTAVVVAVLVGSNEAQQQQQSSKDQLAQFDQFRTEFEVVVLQLIADPGRTYAHPSRIGPFSIIVAYDNSAGEVYFHETPPGGTSLGWNPGWVYSPHGRPVGFSDSDMEDVGGHWYRFTNVTVD